MRSSTIKLSYLCKYKNEQPNIENLKEVITNLKIASKLAKRKKLKKKNMKKKNMKKKNIKKKNMKKKKDK